MTVQQAIARINAERAAGHAPTYWTLPTADIAELMDELQSGADYKVMSKAEAIEQGIEVKCGPPPAKNSGYAMTFMGVDIYRGAL